MRPNGPLDGLTVTSAGSVLVRRPVPRNLGISIVSCCPAEHQWTAINALEAAMEPVPWLDMALRCANILPTGPAPILDALRRHFGYYKADHFIHGEDLRWWNHVEHPLTIWRGAFEGINERGICYSQDPLTASRYADPRNASGARAILIEATVQNGDYIAHRRRRDEFELLVLPERPRINARHVLPLPDEFYAERTVSMRIPYTPEELA